MDFETSLQGRDAPHLHNYTDRYIFALVTKAERTREMIIARTAPVFNVNGYDGTSLTDLCKATGLTKGALYGNFRDKDDLAQEAFRFSIGEMRRHWKECMDKQHTNKGKLQALLKFFTTYVLNPPVKGGCPLLNTAVDADDHRTQMKKVVAEELQYSIKNITQLLDLGKKAGEFRKDFDSRTTALQFFCAIEGAIMFSRVSSSDEAMRAVVKSIKEKIDQISISKPK